ncbi:hypothetical protein Tco_0499581, partial [Tanacetum coccineum]
NSNINLSSSNSKIIKKSFNPNNPPLNLIFSFKISSFFIERLLDDLGVTTAKVYVTVAE